MIDPSKNLVYLFKIETENGKKYYLTSANKEIISEKRSYFPYSGLSLVSGSFNDSAENSIILHGIFEKKGIAKDVSLKGATVKIMYLKGGSYKHFVTYFCTQHVIKDLDFEITCESETIKYNQSIIQMFSKTCRANLGDDKCKVNLDKYSVSANLTLVGGNLYSGNIGAFYNTYFKGGYVEVDGYRHKILSHIGKNIEFDGNIHLNEDGQKQVTLIPGCDKNFRTCCYSFENAVNFRGEPVVPEFDIIKN